MNKNLVLAVTYSRVSTEGQVDKYGLDSQKRIMEEYASKNGIEIVETFVEEGVCGDNELNDRVALVKLVVYLEEHTEIKTVIIPELSRLARDLMVQESIIADFKKREINLISVKEPDLCSNEPTRIFFRQVMGAANQYDKAMTVLRLKNGRISKALKGEHPTGRIPMGYDSVIKDGKKTLRKNDEEVKLVQYVFELRDRHGLSFQRIADRLNDENFKPKGGGEKFYTSTVQKIYKNPKYQGEVQLKDGNTVVAKATNENLRLI